ncbi:hypothetical protein PsYK624_080810 [Phanerochaete sordida]|uniref:Uncharacterized protein n=1 Tax=Phanerochaete sordida TaxID=48140 RepID=A0A9P3LET5_9APHY|nr:hypothetical protein PsYK624_080810 [Phanerochaete sordida]
MDRLPEEILRAILAYNLRIPHAEFLLYRDYYHGAAAPDPPRSASHLLVSKRWLRVGTPLLYECIRLRRPEHTAVVAQLLRAHPHVGAAVRCLRLEGGLGKELAHVAKHITGLRSLYVDVRVKSAHSIAGLKKALSMLNPVGLYIKEQTRHSTNKKMLEVRSLLYAHIKDGRWTSLRTVSLSNRCWHYAPLSRLADSLAQSSVEDFVCDVEDARRWIERGHIQNVTKLPSIQRVLCRGIALQKSTEQLLRKEGLLHADRPKFVFVHGGAMDDERPC